MKFEIITVPSTIEHNQKGWSNSIVVIDNDFVMSQLASSTWLCKYLAVLVIRMNIAHLEIELTES